jgi:putative ABC transport system substrate-binding protein
VSRLDCPYGKRPEPLLFPARNQLGSDGPDFDDFRARSASCIDKILTGARPGDLSIQQPTKCALVINLKTAKTLGPALPQSLLPRADKVLQ